MRRAWSRLLVLLGLLAVVVPARPAGAVRITTEVFLADLNDVFFGVGELLVFVADPSSFVVTIDQAASHLTALGEPIDIGLTAVLDPATGQGSGSGFIGAPQIGLVTTTDHADCELVEVAAPVLPVDLWDGLGVGASISLVQTNGCGDSGGAGLVFGQGPDALPRHFVECGTTLFLTAFVVSEDFGDIDCAAAPDGARCEDGDACSAGDTCQSGACVAGAALDCDDGDACTVDSCEALAGCEHVGGDRDDDAVCDDVDNCPLIVNPAQADLDPADGVGDACQCRLPAPGVCVLDGKGAPEPECVTELLVTPVPAVVVAKNLPATTVVCADGDACDADAVQNGSCRFGIAVCLNNQDPRGACEQTGVEAFTLRRPVRTSSRAHEAAAAEALIDAVQALAPSSLEGSRLETVRFAPRLDALDRCSGYVDVDVPVRGARGKLKLSLSTTAGPAVGQSAGERDKDALKLYCEP